MGKIKINSNNATQLAPELDGQVRLDVHDHDVGGWRTQPIP